MNILAIAGTISCFVVGLLIIVLAIFLSTTTQWVDNMSWIGLLLIVAGIVIGVIARKKNRTKEGRVCPKCGGSGHV